MDVIPSLPVTVMRADATHFTVTVPVVGGSCGDVAEWTLADLGGGRWVMDGLRILDLTSVRSPIALGAQNTYEYAIWLVRAGSDVNSGSFLGNGHGHEASTAARFWLDDRDVATLPVGVVARGRGLNVVQSRTAFLPGDGVTSVGSSSLVHEFSADGLYVGHGHTWLPGYEIVDSFYSAMMLAGPTVDTVQIGAAASFGVLHDGIQKGNAQASSATFSSSAHPYRLTLSLPSGGPDTTGDWSHAQGLKMWCLDRQTPDGPKVYVNYLSSPARMAAGPTSHAARYTVSV